MAVDFSFKFPLVNGLHARPASHFEAVTSRFRSNITLTLERTRFRANARSVLSMVSADVKFDDLCVIHAEGDDEQPAMEAVQKFLRDELPHCDEALPELPAAEAAVVLPRSLIAAGLSGYLKGRAVCGGFGRGKLVLVGGIELPPGLHDEKATSPAAEQSRARSAVAAVASSIDQKISVAGRPQEAEVLKAHVSIVRDVLLWDTISDEIVANHRTAGQAIFAACEKFSDTLRKSESAYLRERTLDVDDICSQLLDAIELSRVPHGTGNGSAKKPRKTGPVFTEPSICVADHLTPGQFLAMDHNLLKGLVLCEGGSTSHTVILARSMNIPTLVGVTRTPEMTAGRDVLVDGDLGLVVLDIPLAVGRYYDMERERIEGRRRQLDAFRDLPGKTSDGHQIEIGANIASAEEAAIAFGAGAQGIGLFRTEMLFMDRDTAPSETEQTDIYSAAVHAAAGKPVIIRLIDIGGDKPATYLHLPDEENPFLGFRGARIYGEFSDLVKSQVRAILRASVDAAPGSVKMLVPMVCCIEEVRHIRQLLNDAAAELRAEGIALATLPLLGVMIEIPSLAFLMPELCRELDFFSIGSNDLTQYFLAADRANQKVASLYQWSHPAFLRLLKSVVDQAHTHGKWVGLCGEMGDQPAALPILIGLGLDEISVSAPRIGSMKAALGNASFSHCQKLLDSAISFCTRGEVESLLQSESAVVKVFPLLSAELIVPLDGLTKAEVIKQATDRLFLTGRTPAPQRVEDAVWAREETYSTGFGYGFALPHCKSEHLTANSIVIAKLANPVEWGSLDSKPVEVVILLAIRAQEHAKEHMKIFAKLSRLVMRDEFRDRVRSESDSNVLASFLEESLGLNAAS